jgi:alpha-tubulin suppressor-like RCC1 family protein
MPRRLPLPLIVIGLAACGSDKTVAPPPTVVTVVVTPGADTLWTIGRTRQFTAQARDASGTPVSGVTITWQSSNPGVATVDAATGFVTAVGNGLSVISAHASGIVGQANLAVAQFVASVQVTPPTAGLATVGVTQQFTAVAKDSGGATVAGVRFLWLSSDPAVATVDTSGVARSKGQGDAIITAAGRGVPGNAVLTVTQTATTLAFVVQPTTTVAGEAMNPAVQVEVRDAAGNLVKDARTPVTIDFVIDPHNAALRGSTTVNAVSGVATFSGLSIEIADSGYIFDAKSTGLTPVTSGSFNITPATPSALRFVQLDTADTAGQALPFLVKSFDRFGNFSPATGGVAFALAANPAGGALFGNSVLLTNGVASLSGVVIQKAGFGYELKAVGYLGATGFDSAYSPVFRVRPASATHLTYTHVQTAASLGFPLFTTGVAFHDVFENVADTSGTVTLGLGPNPWQATLLGTVSVFGTGSVTYGPVVISKPGSYAVVASAPGFAPETSAAVTITFSIPSMAAGGGDHSCVLDIGVATCWGANSTGQLGRPADGGDSVASVVLAGGRTFTALALGSQHSCALTSGGAAFCWGDNQLGQLGSVTGATHSDSATAVAGGQSFTALSAGAAHTCGIVTDGTAYCWGDNSAGQLGDSGREASSATPVIVYGGRKFVAIAAGAHHTCGIGTDSSAYCWGDNSFGQLGDSVATGVSDTAVRVVRGHKFKAIVTAGDGHSCAVGTTGAAYCWGHNNHGQLGDHKLGVDADTPTVVVTGVYTQLVAGGDHTCGLFNFGVYCWGSNAFGELGYGTPPTDNDQPANVGFPLGVSRVAVGSSHTCAIEAKLNCWGRNAAGQVGDNTRVDRARPAIVFTQ